MRGSDAFLTLRDGTVFPLAAIRVALALEDRGILLTAGDDGTLLVRPADALTAADAVTIRAHKHALLAWARYCEREA